MVIAFDDAVADWASRPIATFQDGAFRPIVLRASSIPRVRSEDARALLEVVMKTEGYQYQSEWMRQNFTEGKAEGMAEGKAEGKAEGRAEGKAEGRAEGKAEGKAEGRAEGLRGAVRAICEAHGLGWEAARAAVLESLSIEDLERLLVRVSRDRRWPEDA